MTTPLAQLKTDIDEIADAMIINQRLGILVFNAICNTRDLCSWERAALNDMVRDKLTILRNDNYGKS